MRCALENFTNAINCGRTNPEPLPLSWLYLPLAEIEGLEIPPDFQFHVHVRARDFLRATKIPRGNEGDKCT